MIDKKDIIFKITEANDSYRILIKYVGSMESASNLVLLKWPDAFRSYVDDDIDLLSRDLFELICIPIKILALALIERGEKEGLKFKLYESEVDNTFKVGGDPIKAKDNLIRICDIMIHNLKNKGINIDFIRGEK